jgi:hypothetical protein
MRMNPRVLPYSAPDSSDSETVPGMAKVCMMTYSIKIPIAAVTCTAARGAWQQQSARGRQIDRRVLLLNPTQLCAVATIALLLTG